MSDGWIPHTPGYPMPCDGETLVHVHLREEAKPQENEKPIQAASYDWGDFPGKPWQIIAWKPANEPEMKDDNELITDAARRLLEAIRNWDITDDKPLSECVEALHAALPEPEEVEPFECWVNIYPDGDPNAHTSESKAVMSAGSYATRTAVHLREVREREWKRWTTNGAYIYKGASIIAHASPPALAEAIAEAHNRDMEELAKQ